MRISDWSQTCALPISVIGAVTLGDDASIWPGCVVRGDVNSIHIGARTNVQDGTIVHVTHDGPFNRPGGLPTVIANDVTVGHAAILQIGQASGKERGGQYV